MSEVCFYKVMRGNLQIGGVVRASDCDAEGWKFIPMGQANASRKIWPSPESAVKGRIGRNDRLVAVESSNAT